MWKYIYTMCKVGKLLAVNCAWRQLGISESMCSFLLNVPLIMLVISTEAAYCTALCWTVGHRKSDVFWLLHYSLWQDWHPPLLHCILGAWFQLYGGHWCTQIMNTGSLGNRTKQDGTWMFSRYLKMKTSLYINHPHTRPIVCFLVPLSSAFPFPCLSLTCSISIFPAYPQFLPSFSWFFLSLASWWPFLCFVTAPVRCCPSPCATCPQ